MTEAGRSEGGRAVALYCLPHAGGSSAFFHQWSHGDLPPSVKVVGLDSPGHGARFSEPLCTEALEVAVDLERRLVDEATEPFALFGHSIGALIAYELTRRLESRGLAPAVLFVSAHHAPHRPSGAKPIHALPDDEFLERLKRLGGVPQEVLADPELLALVLPVVRADLRASETYRYVPSGPIGCAIVAIGGSCDPLVPPEDLAAWRYHTSRPFRTHLFPSGHFYLKEHQREVLALIAAGLREHAYQEGSAI